MSFHFWELYREKFANIPPFAFPHPFVVPQRSFFVIASDRVRKHEIRLVVALDPLHRTSDRSPATELSFFVLCQQLAEERLGHAHYLGGVEALALGWRDILWSYQIRGAFEDLVKPHLNDFRAYARFLEDLRT